MTSPDSIKRQIIEGLYCEALVLTDEVRSAFRSLAANQAADLGEDVALALTCEGMRTTTRMMQAVAWLLDQRAGLAGTLSEWQLRRRGRLHPCAQSDPESIALLNPELSDLIAATEQFHARLMRLDQGWRADHPKVQSDFTAVLRQRLGLQAS